jgi:cupin fold WbuC family metalloprotein
MLMASDVQLITRNLLDSVLERARQSPRRRTNHNFHPTLTDNPHRFLNVMLAGTYIQPHRHLEPPKSETFLVLEGRAVIFIFDDSGVVREHSILGPDSGAWGIDIAPGVWHSLAVLSEHAFCFEVKPGPYAPAADKEFADWAPREGDAAASSYLGGLLQLVAGGGGS